MQLALKALFLRTGGDRHATGEETALTAKRRPKLYPSKNKKTLRGK